MSTASLSKHSSVLTHSLGFECACQDACSYCIAVYSAPVCQHILACLQVRQLQSIGFTVSKEVLAEVETANRFYRHGLLMKQVVNFYNNSATEMIPCQKPMLLQVR